MMTILFIVAALLAIYAINQVLGIFELSGELRGKKVYEVSDKDNRTQSILMLLFLFAYFAFVIYQVVSWGDKMLPVPASEHGVVTDNLMNVSWAIIIPVFIITHILLFYFAFKYVYNKDRRADFFAHSNKLEMIWTLVPTVVLTSLILYGLNTWNNIVTMVDPESDHVKIELYAQQFSWTARYAGNDMELGYADIHYIEGANTLGMDNKDNTGKDDIIVRGEFHLPVNKPVQFQFRSQDVIHSAYMPHFRAQMNCVPGMKTYFKFTPTYTTKEMKEITGNPDFEYILLCNKICGAAHYNMQMNIIVESEEEYNKWLREQPTYGSTLSEVENSDETVLAESLAKAPDSENSRNQ